jgi:hypothetical protein
MKSTALYQNLNIPPLEAKHALRYRSAVREYQRDHPTATPLQWAELTLPQKVVFIMRGAVNCEVPPVTELGLLDAGFDG